MSNQHSIITLKQAIETLGVDKARLLQEVQAVGAKLLIPFPAGAAIVVMRDRFLPHPKNINRCQFEAAMNHDRGEIDYFIPSNSLLRDIENFPEIVCDHITHLAIRIKGKAAVSIARASDKIKEAPWTPKEMSHALSLLCRTVTWGIRLPEGAAIALDVTQACLLKADVARIQGLSKPDCPPSIEDFGEFQPAEHTTRLVRDLNTAYHLFRVKFPVNLSDSNSRRLVESWLDETWNGQRSHKNKRDVGQTTVEGAAAVILEAGATDTGEIILRQAVKERHAEGAPNRLMLLDQLLEDQAVGRKCGVSKAEIDFRQQFLIGSSIKELGIRGDRYFRLVKKALSTQLNDTD